MTDSRSTTEAGVDSTAGHGRSVCTTLAIFFGFLALARELSEMGRRSDALLLCRVALRLNPDNEAARSLVGEDVDG